MKRIEFISLQKKIEINFNEQLLFPKYLNYRYTLIKIKNI